MPHPTLTTRCAGFALPLFSLRSERDAGIGEIMDLIPLLRWGAGFGQRIIQLLPINETAPGEASPYTALSAFAIDPLYVSVHAVPHASAVPAVRAETARLPREEIRDGKLQALAVAFDAFQHRGGAAARRRLGAFVETNRDWLDDYALYRVLKEEYGFASWEQWPASLRGRQTRALAQAAARRQPRIEFLRYVQWVAAEQWACVRREAASLGVWLKGDLPFVISRDSADVWARQDEFDPDYSVGAPPDDFSATGQSWGLPMYDWGRVRATDFAWWRRRVRQARELYDLFRIDHIVGFFRTYAIPHDPTRARGFMPAAEADQRAQGEAFLDAVLEASDGALPIGEDLGSVPTWVRQTLHRLGIPGYKVFRWERDDHHYRDPRRYDAVSVATTGTHDTDTLVEWWAALPAREREQVGAALRLTAGEPPALRGQLLGRLYEAGSAFVIVPIQDLFGWTDRINVPATPSRANWNWRVPFTVEHLAGDPALRATMAALRELIVAAGRTS